jgi:hypothetical protein
MPNQDGMRFGNIIAQKHPEGTTRADILAALVARLKIPPHGYSTGQVWVSSNGNGMPS